MRVRNIVISNKDMFEEALIRDLIKNDISYVQIEDEFHFNDKIYRFFDTTLDKDLIEELLKSPVPIAREIDEAVNLYKLPPENVWLTKEPDEENIKNNCLKMPIKKNNEQLNKPTVKKENYYRNKEKGYSNNKKGKAMTKRYYK